MNTLTTHRPPASKPITAPSTQSWQIIARNNSELTNARIAGQAAAAPQIQLQSPHPQDIPTYALHSRTPSSTHNQDSVPSRPLAYSNSRTVGFAGGETTDEAAREQSVFVIIGPPYLQDRGWTVLQRNYKPRSEKNLGELRGIRFSVGGRAGIRLQDALDKIYTDLDFRDDSFVVDSPSISVRLELLGFQPWTQQVRVKDYKKPPRPITVATLATKIGKAVAKFIEANDESTHATAGVNSTAFTVHLVADRLILLALTQRSLASWQLQLAMSP